MRMNANYTNLCGERGESRLSEPAAFRPARGYISILLSLSISTFFIVATATKSFCYCSLLRRFRLTLDHRDFVLILFSRDNLRLAAQAVAFSQQLSPPKFFPLRVRRSTQTLARIAHRNSWVSKTPRRFPRPNRARSFGECLWFDSFRWRFRLGRRMWFLPL